MPLLAAVKEHERWLREQTLADVLEPAPLTEPLAVASIEIAGGEATVALARATPASK